MKRVFELPPPPRGTVTEQLRELREYLLRLVLAMNEEE